MSQNPFRPGNDYKPGKNNNNQNDPNNQNNPNNPNNKNNKGNLIRIILCLVLLAIVIATWTSTAMSSSTEIPYNEFVEMVDDDVVEKVVLSGNELVITVKPENDMFPSNLEEVTFGALLRSGDTYHTNMVGDENALLELLEGKGIEFSKKQASALASVFSVLLNLFLPILVLFLFMRLLMGRMGGKGGIMGVGKSKARNYVTKETGVTFQDVAGEDEAKESLQEVVEFLHSPEKYVEIGAKLPKGALLVGPPGTGKTLLAKAVAGEAHVPFFSLSGSEFVEMFVGVGASRVRDLFEEAKKNAPCIIFIDEIDAIGKTRDSHYGGNDEREQTLNQLLAEMDGFDSEKGLLIIAATNRPEVLDPALLRPGRFDRRVIVDRPDLKGRIEILKVHAKRVTLDETVNFEEIALATSGAVGSELANMVNEAAILAVKHGRKAVCQKDLFEAVEVVLVGKEKKDRILSKEERRIVSYHEVGHALLSALQKDAEPVQKITIVPRTMGALGYVMQVPEEEKYLNSKKELEAMVVGLLGGRAAEEIVFDTVTTGASNDIERATKIVRAMITQYGMSDKFGLMGIAQQANQYLDGRLVMNCGDATTTEIDHEIMKILKESYEEAKRLLNENRDALDELAEFLIRKETITGKEFMDIFRDVQKGRAEAEEARKAETYAQADSKENGQEDLNAPNFVLVEPGPTILEREDDEEEELPQKPVFED